MSVGIGKDPRHGGNDRRKTTFKYYPYCRYAVDITVQESNRPIGNITEDNFHKSWKQKIYGYKTEVSELTNGLAILCTPQYAGSIADIDIFIKHIHIHVQLLKKSVEELEIMDSGTTVKSIQCSGPYCVTKDIKVF